MPSFTTHHIFAATVQRVTGDSAARIAAAYPAGYRWGAQGPEPLLLYHLPFPSQLHRLAHRMRTEPPAELFEALCAAAAQERNTAALAYVFGFCTNYALDRVTHAFIQAQADRLALFMPGYSAAARRKLAESDIDGILIADYIAAEPAKFEAFRLLDPNAPECTVLARVVSHAAKQAYGTRVAPASVYRSLHDMRRILHRAGLFTYPPGRAACRGLRQPGAPPVAVRRRRTHGLVHRPVRCGGAARGLAPARCSGAVLSAKAARSAFFPHKFCGTSGKKLNF